MVAPIVYAYEESKDVAENLAKYVVRVQNDALMAQVHDARFNIAVSGGSMIKTLRIGLKDRDDVKWDKWNIFFADERLVPLDHEDSNYGGLKKELLDYLDTKPKVFTINPDSLDNSERCAEEYATQMTKVCGENEAIPKLDLMLLGCGPDGHTCSLFPGHALLNEESKNVAAIEDSPKPPPRRITVTKPVIQAAKHVTFVAEGAGKAAILKDVFEHPEKGLPSSQVNQLAKRTTWFVNNDAVKGVNVETSKY